MVLVVEVASGPFVFFLFSLFLFGQKRGNNHMVQCQNYCTHHAYHAPVPLSVKRQQPGTNFDRWSLIGNDNPGCSASVISDRRC